MCYACELVKLKIRKGVAPLLIILGIIWVRVFDFGLPFTDSDSLQYSWENSSLEDFEDFHDISCIEITYTADCSSEYVYRFYRIENIHGTYYNNTGEKIDPQLIRRLAESFTDFYESDYEYSYDNFFLTDYQPHFTVTIALTGGREIILKSDSGYHCFIPWNIEYRNVLYVQYNGRIPSALLPILVTIDKNFWSSYDKQVRWGCCPAAVPERCVEFSSTFPVTESVVLPEEEQGKIHVVWDKDLQNSLIGGPFYFNGKVFVALRDRLVSLDAETGEILWEHRFEPGNIPVVYAEDLLVHEGAVYVSAPDSWIYSLDSETGALLWKYKTNAYNVSLRIIEDYLIAVTGGIVCLNRGTGDLIWELTDDTWNEKIYDDKILLESLRNDRSYYRLIDGRTGEVIWEENAFEVKYPVYRDGVLYFLRVAENAFVSMNVKNRKEWSHSHDNTLGHVEVFKDRILLVLFDSERMVLHSLVLLSNTGSEIWEYIYPEKITWEFGCIMNGKLLGGILFIVREGGIAEAFDVENGEKLWEIEAKGTEITGFEVFEKRIYLSANDGRLYCLDETGRILWIFAAEDELAKYPDDALIYVSQIEEGFILVATADGNLYALSV